MNCRGDLKFRIMSGNGCCSYWRRPVGRRISYVHGSADLLEGASVLRLVQQARRETIRSRIQVEECRTMDLYLEFLFYQRYNNSITTGRGVKSWGSRTTH